MLRAEIRHALRTVALDVALEVEAGDCLVLAGASGAGKTSILRVVAGLLRPDAARVICGDAVWTDTDARRVLPPEARGCGLLFQDYALFGRMPAWRNVAYGMRGVRWSQRRAEATAWLARFGVAHLAEERPPRLSGGERQRVALARALAARPRALLLDEPLAALDPATRGKAVRELASVLRDAGVPAIVVTHDFAEAATLGTRVAVLEGGRIVQCASPAELAARPATAFVADLTGATVLRGNAAPRPDGLTVVTLDGGGSLVTTDIAAGRVDVVVRPWEVGLAPPGDAVAEHGSARNHLTGEVVALTPVGNRVRVALAVPEPLTADVTAEAVERLGLGIGSAATATFKATATRIMGG